MSRLGRRLRKLRKKQSGGAPAAKVSMKSTAKAGRQAPGTPRSPRRAAPLSNAARRSAADTAQRMDEMGSMRDQQSATPKPSTPKASAPPSTATTAQDLADVGYGTAMSPSTATTAQDLADVGYGTGMAPATPEPDPFTGSMFENPNIDPMREKVSLGLDIPEIPGATQAPQGAPANIFAEPSPYQKGRDFGASFPSMAPAAPVIPGVSGPPLETGDIDAITDAYEQGIMPPTPGIDTPLPEGDPTTIAYLRGEMPPTPGIDTPLPGAAPGQMAPDPGYLPPPMEMSEEEMDDLVSQIEAQRSAEKQQERQSNILNLRDYLKRAGLRKILPGLRGMGLAE